MSSVMLMAGPPGAAVRGVRSPPRPPPLCGRCNLSRLSRHSEKAGSKSKHTQPSVGLKQNLPPSWLPPKKLVAAERVVRKTKRKAGRLGSDQRAQGLVLTTSAGPAAGTSQRRRRRGRRGRRLLVLVLICAFPGGGELGRRSWSCTGGAYAGRLSTLEGALALAELEFVGQAEDDLRERHRPRACRGRVAGVSRACRGRVVGVSWTCSAAVRCRPGVQCRERAPSSATRARALAPQPKEWLSDHWLNEAVTHP